MNTIVVAFILYLSVVLIIGFISVRMMKTIDDFALGGHRLGPWVIAFSERASGESAWLLIGLPGAALMAGLLELWTVVGCVSGIIISWIIIAKPLRQATEDHGAITLPEVLSKKMNDESGVIRLLSSLIIVFFFTFYVAAQFSGAGKVLNVSFGLTHIEGMILGAIIIILYTMLGGFLAVAWTDMLQGIIMIGTLVILPVVGWIELSQISSTESVFNWSTLFGGEVGTGAFIGAIGGLSWGFGYMGQPHLVTRFMAIRNSEEIYISRRIAAAWAIPAFFGSMLIGLVGLQLIPSGTLQYEGTVFTSLDQISDPEKLMPIMATNLLHPWLAGILISGAIAAMMSTADSQLLVSTSVLTEDLLGNAMKRRGIHINFLTLGRILTVLVGIIAFYLAWQTRDLVFGMISYAWSGLGASFGPALILTLWWKRTTRKGVIAGLLTGSITTIVWSNIENLQTMITERFVSFILAFLMIVIVSLISSNGSHSSVPDLDHNFQEKHG